MVEGAEELGGLLFYFEGVAGEGDVEQLGVAEEVGRGDGDLVGFGAAEDFGDGVTVHPGKQLFYTVEHLRSDIHILTQRLKQHLRILLKIKQQLPKHPRIIRQRQ